MVTISDIYKSVCSLLLAETGTVILEDRDLTEPTIRPCFKVLMDTVNTGFYSSAIRRVQVYFKIYFFATDREHSKSEIMDIENTLSLIFMKPLKIADRCSVYIDDVEFEKITNGMLDCSFNFEIGTEFKDESGLEPMEDLDVKMTMERLTVNNFDANVEEDEDEEESDSTSDEGT